MRNILLLIAVLALAGGSWYVWSQKSAEDAEGNMVACTMEAKLCPDGVTYVGRQGPKCEFAACPTVATSTATATSTVKEVKLNKTISAFNFSITPTEVVEDSRCPTDVQCIQAGTVRVKTTLAGGLGEYSAVLELNKPLTNEEVSITLTSVAPLKNSKHTTAPGEYVFTFTITKR